MKDLGDIKTEYDFVPFFTYSSRWRCTENDSLICCCVPFSKVTSINTVSLSSKHSISGFPPEAKLVGKPSSSETKFGFTTTFGNFLRITKEVKNSKRKGCSITRKISSSEDFFCAKLSISVLMDSHA